MWLVNATKVLVEHCNFINNTGIQPDLMNSTHNSGALVLSYHGITGAVATVHNCMFVNNTACHPPCNSSDPRPQAYIPFGHGGGLVVRVADSTTSTTIEISDSTFVNNKALYSGGAMYVALNRHPRNNHLIIRSSLFEECSAMRTGGGLSIQVSIIYISYITYTSD